MAENKFWEIASIDKTRTNIVLKKDGSELTLYFIIPPPSNWNIGDKVTEPEPREDSKSELTVRVENITKGGGKRDAHLLKASDDTLKSLGRKGHVGDKEKVVGGSSETGSNKDTPDDWLNEDLTIAGIGDNGTIAVQDQSKNQSIWGKGTSSLSSTDFKDWEEGQIVRIFKGKSPGIRLMKNQDIGDSQAVSVEFMKKVESKL